MKYESIREINNKLGVSYKVQINYGPRDKRRQYSKTFKVSDYPSKQACLNAAKTHRDVMKMRLGVIGQVDGDQTLKEVYELRCATYVQAPETRRRYDSNFRKFILSVLDGNMLFRKITYLDITRTLENMTMIASQDTINRLGTLWHQLYKTAILNNIVQYNLFDKVIIPKSHYVTKRRDVMTSFQEVQEVCNALPDTEYAKLVRFALMLMYYTGIRPAECFVLTGEDFDFDAMYLRINKQLAYDEHRKAFSSTPKTDGSERLVPLDPSILPYKELVHTGLIFTHSGVMMSTFTVNAYIKKYKKGFTLYKMRHLFATDLLIKDKIDAVTVQSLMGHRDIETTLSYARTNEMNRRNAVLGRNKR